MQTRVFHIWENLTSGYWFLPTTMIAVATGLAFGLLYLDSTVIGDRDWFYSGGAAGARTLLSTVAASVITVAGVVFSITIAALTQASMQFGPRLLRNFMRDTGNQVVLGTFVSTFLYCLLVLRTIEDQEAGKRAFVPEASVTVAVLLAGASIAVLVYFIHHISVYLQAPEIVAVVRRELDRVIARLPRNHQGTATPLHSTEDLLPRDFDHAASIVCSESDGYLQAVDFDELIALAESADVVLRLDYRPGDYLIRGCRLARAYPAARCGADLSKQVRETFICGSHGTPEQDVEYAVRQLVEIAVRALSPGTNDPFTAVNCIDALGSAICHVSRSGMPGSLRYDRQGKLRIVTTITTFQGIADMAFNQIRQYGQSHVAISIRLLEIFAECADQIRGHAQRRVLLEHGEMVYHQSEAATPIPRDREHIRQRWEELVCLIGPQVGDK